MVTPTTYRTRLTTSNNGLCVLRRIQTHVPRLLHKVLTALAIGSLLLSVPLSAQTLTLMGDGLTESTGIAVQGGAPAFSQSPTALTINTSFGLGGGIWSAGFLADGEEVVWDWSGVTAFALTMSVTSADPNMPFILEFFAIENNEPLKVGEFTGNTEGQTSIASLVTLAEAFRGDLGAVVGMTLTFSGEGAINATINDITAVPEPSTWALLGLGAAILGMVALRRRRKGVTA